MIKYYVSEKDYAKLNQPVGSIFNHEFLHLRFHC